MAMLDNYDPSTALSAYYPTRDERRPARLWATEKLLHDMAELGMVEFFEGPGTDPTALSGYSVDKVWLQVSSGITAQPGTVRAYDGSGDASDIANWPELTTGAMARMFGAALQTDVDDLRLNGDVFVANAASLKALDTSEHGAAFLRSSEQPYLWQTGDYSAEIAAGDPRYVEADDVDGSEGAWVKSSSVSGGAWGSGSERIIHLADRIFVDGAAGFNGSWGYLSDYTGLTDEVKGLHAWGFRDASLMVDSSIGGMAIVGHAQTSKTTEYPYYPSYKSTGIGVSGFTINDEVLGAGWAGYFDTVKMAGSGFTVTVEQTLANLDGDAPVLNPFNFYGVMSSAADGFDGGVNSWVASGAGLDVVASDLYSYLGIRPWDVRSISGWQAFGTSFLASMAGVVAWAPSTAYDVGDKAYDPYTMAFYFCLVAHTSGGSNFPADRTANPTYWRAFPAARAGITFLEGSLEEEYAGSGLASAIKMPELYRLEWGHRTSGGAYEPSAFIYGTRVSDASDAVAQVFGEEAIDWYIGATNALHVSTSGVGLPSSAGVIWDSGATRVVHDGSGGVRIYTGSSSRFEISSAGHIKLPSTSYYADDAAAASGGVPMGCVYLSGSGPFFLTMRTT